jgi:hypothetical protein
MIRPLIALSLLAGCTTSDRGDNGRSAPRATPQPRGDVAESTEGRTIRDCTTPFARVAMADEQEAWVVFLPVAELATLRLDQVVRIVREPTGTCFVRIEDEVQGDPGEWRPAR